MADFFAAIFVQMDSITHIVTGACLGEAFAGKKLGRKAMLWGAMAQSLPDIDFIASFWMDMASNLLAHRGFTHSLLFIVLASFVLALAAERWHRPHNITLTRWAIFFFAEMAIHLLLDLCNSYGTGIFEPFSHQRFSFNVLYVADPFLSVWAGIAFVVLLILRKRDSHRKFWWRLGLGMPVIYLIYCIFNKISIDRDTRQMLAAQAVPYTRYFTTPTSMNNWLWYIVAGDDKGYHVGYRSVFDSKKHIDFHYFPRNESLLESVDNHEELNKLIRFSQQFYTAELWHDTLVFNDLRFGQVVGWANPNEQFVFHYFIKDPAGNDLVIQRGRFAKVDKNAIIALINRIKGN